MSINIDLNPSHLTPTHSISPLISDKHLTSIPSSIQSPKDTLQDNISQSSLFNTCINHVKHYLESTYIFLKKILSFLQERLTFSARVWTKREVPTGHPPLGPQLIQPANSHKSTLGISIIGTCDVQDPLNVNTHGMFVNSNKEFIYQQLLHNAPSNALHAQLTKYSLDNRANIASHPLFRFDPPLVHERTGGFAYDASTAHTKHWVANFADEKLLGFCHTPLLAQDEHQVVEHPVLYHLKRKLTGSISEIRGDEIALIENAFRLGNLDTMTPLPKGKTLYGNHFAHASQAEIKSKLTELPEPHPSNIFAMAAPRIPANLLNQPYQKEHLEHLFYRAYTAFVALKEKSGDARAIIHTGNWGAGAFGNDAKTVALIQLAAARFADIKEMCYYPLSNHDKFQMAEQLLNQIASSHPHLTVDEFLSHLADHADVYGLRYGKSNGT
jgi:hypothetical protein